MCLLPWEGWDWRSSSCILPADDEGRCTPRSRTSLNFPALLQGNQKGVVQRGAEAAPPVLLLLGVSSSCYSPSLSPFAPPVPPLQAPVHSQF